MIDERLCFLVKEMFDLIFKFEYLFIESEERKLVSL
jgi:hypothetical protein